MSLRERLFPQSIKEVANHPNQQKLDELDNLLALQMSPTPTSGLAQYSGPWTKKQVRHLVKRTMFGAKKSDVDFFANMTITQAVDILISPLIVQPDPPLNNYTQAYNQNDPDVPAGQTWVNANFGDLEYSRNSSLNNWWHSQMFNQNQSIVEKMTLFFHNLLVTSFEAVEKARWMYINVKTYRENCLGNYKDLVKKATLDPQMLRYLNGHYNTKTSPDENYARELQELFTLGVGAGYSESDVQQAAKVLTGFRTISTNPPSDVYYFDPSKHDTNNKTFPGFYGGTIITGGATEAAALAEIDALLTMIFARDETARFICREIYRFFVHYNIDATIENNVIVPLATMFKNGNYEIAPVLKTLFKSQHFYDVLANGGMIKSPVDYLVGMCREFSMPLPPTSQVAQYYEVFNRIRTEAILQDQEITNPPNVAGWNPYYQSPAFHRIWISANTLQKRNKFSDKMASTGYTVQGYSMKLYILNFTATLSNPGDPNALIQEVIDIMLREDLSATIKTFLKDFLLTGQTTDSYWTTAWANYISAPSNPTYLNIVNTRLTNLYKYIMSMPEYQLM